MFLEVSTFSSAAAVALASDEVALPPDLAALTRPTAKTLIQHLQAVVSNELACASHV